jgi:hypothetical protein
MKLIDNITMTISRKKLSKLTEDQKFQLWKLLIASCLDVNQIDSLNRSIGSTCFKPEIPIWIKKENDNDEK